MRAEVMAGPAATLAWYFLLVALANAVAAAWVAYGLMLGEGVSPRGLRPSTRHWPGWLIPTVLGLAGLGWILLLAAGGRGPLALAGYCLAALANGLLAVQAGADAAHHAEVFAAGYGREQEFAGPSLNDHLPPPGLGPPINRTLWSLVWAVVAVGFQAVGLVLALGARLGVPEGLGPWLTGLVSSPVVLVPVSLALVVLWQGRRVWASGLVAWAVLDLGLLALGLALTDPAVRAALRQPLMALGVGVVPLLGLLGWLALRWQVQREALQGLPGPTTAPRPAGSHG